MLEYKLYHKKSIGKPKRGRALRKKGTEKGRPKDARAGGSVLRPLLPVLAGLLVVGLATGACAAIYSWLGHSGLFTVREIRMNECANVSRDEVWGTLKGAPKGNIWTLSSEDIGRRLSTHPWIRDVSVRKAFPDTLVVRIDERRPVAMVNLDALYYVDDQGTVFKRLTAYDPKGFPILTGFSRSELAAKDAVTTQNLKKTIELLRYTDSGVLRSNISEVHFDAQEGFTLVTRDRGLQLKIGTMEFREAMKRIEEAIPKLSQLGQVQGAVDLKTAGRIFVRSGD